VPDLAYILQWWCFGMVRPLNILLATGGGPQRPDTRGGGLCGARHLAVRPAQLQHGPGAVLLSSNSVLKWVTACHRIQLRRFICPAADTSCAAHEFC
jgi:hypothetical protein